MMSRRLLILAALLLLGGACSGRGSEDGGPGRAGGAHVSRHHVVIQALLFDPESLTVALGDTVQWDNHDIVPHTATSALGLWESGNIAPDSSWSTVIHQVGTLPYACRYHPTMTATIITR